jgi:hypothetical protein
MYVVLGTVVNILDEAHQKTATVMNDIILVLGVLTSVVNGVLSAFDMGQPKVI